MSLLDEAQERAVQLENKLRDHVDEVALESPTNVFTKLRAYLIKQSDEMHVNNDVSAALKMYREQENNVLISLGPSFDKGPTSEHFYFDSGARLSFGVTLQQSASRSSLVAFRFHLHLPTGRSPEYLRFDLNPQAHADPLSEPRCHLHLGLDKVRLPLPVLGPFEILDRVFFVVEPALQAHPAGS